MHLLHIELEVRRSEKRDGRLQVTDDVFEAGSSSFSSIQLNFFLMSLPPYQILVKLFSMCEAPPRGACGDRGFEAGINAA